MKASVIGGSSLKEILAVLHRYRLSLACLVVVMCFVLGNDVYAAKKVADRHKDLLGPRRVIDYSALVRRKVAEKTYRSDLTKRFLIDPKAAKQQTLMSAMSFQADTCNQNTSFITTLPYTDSGTTTGATDNYDLSGDPTGCPSPTCEATSGSFNDRGYTYAGTGTGPDVAYSIAFLQPTSLKVTVDPTDVYTTGHPDADDLAIVFYAAACSNDPADAIVVADNAADGNPPDLPDNSETLTFTNLPAGAYNIVVDGYTYAGAATPTSGPYTISVSCVPSLPCSTPAYRRRPRR